MWTRASLKSRAKESVRSNYWPLVLVSFIQLLILALYSSSRFEVQIDQDRTSLRVAGNTLYSVSGIPAWAETAAAAVFVLSLVILLLGFFLLGPLKVGCCRFFLSSMDEKPPFDCMLQNFHEGYFNTACIMLMRNIFCFLWSLLFIIPGIIKTYEYRLVPYLLAEYPYMERHDAFRISQNLMWGHKWNVFVLDLSFLGWHILSGMTFHLVGIFYSDPYRNMTNAHLYRALCLASRQNSEPQPDAH